MVEVVSTTDLSHYRIHLPPLPPKKDEMLPMTDMVEDVPPCAHLLSKPPPESEEMMSMNVMVEADRLPPPPPEKDERMLLTVMVEADVSQYEVESDQVDQYDVVEEVWHVAAVSNGTKLTTMVEVENDQVQDHQHEDPGNANT